MEEMDAKVEIVNMDSVVEGKWTDSQTKLLIKLYNKYKPNLGKIYKAKNKRVMYTTISKEMEAEGIRFSPLQVENKWKTLERKFKRKVKNNNKTGRGRATCEYEQELNEVLGRRPNIFPEFVLDDQTEGQSQDDLRNEYLTSTLESEEVDDPNGHTSSTSNSSPAMNSSTSSSTSYQCKKSKSRTLADELSKLRELKDQQFQEQMARLDKANAIAEKRNILLEKLLNRVEANTD